MLDPLLLPVLEPEVSKLPPEDESLPLSDELSVGEAVGVAVAVAVGDVVSPVSAPSLSLVV